MSNHTLPSLDQIHTVTFDFDGVFTDNKVWVDQEGRESVRCDRGDGLALDLVREFKRRRRWDAEFFILSKERNPVVLARAKKLKLDCRHGEVNKLGYMTRYFADRFPERTNPFAGLVYLGNDLNDLPMIIEAGVSIAPSDAHPLVKKHASMVLQERGGEGFVRAFVEKLLDVENMTLEEIDEYVNNC